MPWGAMLGTVGQKLKEMCWALRTEVPPGLQARQRPHPTVAGRAGGSGGNGVYSGPCPPHGPALRLHTFTGAPGDGCFW